MEILIGLLIIAVGSFGQSSSYVPIKKSKGLELGEFLARTGHIRMARIPASGRTAGHTGGRKSVRSVVCRRRVRLGGLRHVVGRGRTYFRT